MGKKPWKLRIYQDPSTIKKVRKLASDGLFAEDGTEEEAAIKDRDGLFYVHHFSSDIMLKDLAGIIADQAGRKVVFELPDAVEAAGFSKATKARLDSAKINKLGWKAAYDIKEGLERTIEILKSLD